MSMTRAISLLPQESLKMDVEHRHTVRATNGKFAGTRHEVQIATRSAGLMA